MAGSDRVPPTEISSEPGSEMTRVFSTRTKWRSLWSARSGVLKEALDRAATFIDETLPKPGKRGCPGDGGSSRLAQMPKPPSSELRNREESAL